MVKPRLEEPEDIVELLDRQTSPWKRVVNAVEAGVVAFLMQHWMAAPLWAVMAVMLVLVMLLEVHRVVMAAILSPSLAVSVARRDIVRSVVEQLGEQIRAQHAATSVAGDVGFPEEK